MASSPAFAATPRIGIGQVNTGQTNRNPGSTGTNIVDVLTGGASGTKIFEVTIIAETNPADSLVQLFLYNGTNYYIFDDFDIGDPAASSTAVAGYRETRTYENLVLPSSSWKLTASISVTPTAGVVNVWAFGADL